MTTRLTQNNEVSSPTAQAHLPASSRRATVHIPALDGVRGLAAATVFVYHYGGGTRSPTFAIHLVGETIHLGWAGVSLFFVLSGFLITGILLNCVGNPRWWRAFFVRRALRIFPLYYFALLGLVLACLLLPMPAKSIVPLWPLFFYLQGFPGLVRVRDLAPVITIGHFWSLAVEEQFYMVWPILILVAVKLNKVKALCLGLFVASFLFRICIFSLHLNSEWAVYFIGGRAGELAAGGLLATLLRTTEIKEKKVYRWANFLLFSSVTAITVTILLRKETSARDPWLGTVGIALFAGAFAALITLSLEPGLIQRIFQTGFLRWLGKVSYGIYVYHLVLHPAFTWLTLRLFPGATGNRYLLILAAVAMVGTLAAAWLSFIALESPFLSLKEAFGRYHPSAD